MDALSDNITTLDLSKTKPAPEPSTTLSLESVSPTTFNDFLAELRVKIWKLAFTIPKLPTVKEVERTLMKRAKHGKRGKRGRKPKVVAKAVRENPILLAVNLESRCEALKVYQPSFEAELAIPVYFNPQIDTLVLDINSARFFSKYNAQENSMVVRNLALSLGSVPSEVDGSDSETYRVADVGSDVFHPLCGFERTSQQFKQRFEDWARFCSNAQYQNCLYQHLGIRD
jgi:hypothetical protein